MSFHTFTVAKIQVEVFWVVMVCSVVLGYQHFRGPEDGDSMDLWNTGILPQQCMASWPRNPQL